MSARDLITFGLGPAVSTIPTAAEIADAVWDEARDGHTGTGAFGAVSEWASAGGLDADGVRTAIGLATANLDTQLTPLAALATDEEIADAVRTELATELGYIGVPSDLGTGATLAANLVDIEGQTDDIGTGLTAQETRDAMKLAPTAGAPAAGSIDAHLDAAALEATVAAVKAKTDTIGAGAMTVTSPVLTSSTVSITAGCDYMACDGRGLSWAITDGNDWTGATATFICNGQTITGSISTPSGATKTILIDLTAAQTTAIGAGQKGFAVLVTKTDTHILHIITGMCIIAALPS